MVVEYVSVVFSLTKLNTKKIEISSELDDMFLSTKVES